MYECGRTLIRLFLIATQEESLHQSDYTSDDLFLPQFITRGKNAAVLAARLRKMKGRSQVRMVCIDLCAAFRSVVARVFPNAKVVADRFHVIRLITKCLHDFCKQMLPEQRWQRGFIKAIRMRCDRLTAKEQALLEGIFKEHPMVKAAYDFKTRLCELIKLKTLTKRTSKPIFKNSEK